MTSLILGLVTLAAAGFAIWNAIVTTRYARQATHYAREARAANREAWGRLAERQRRNLNRSRP